MPILPPQVLAPYDSVDYVLNIARSIGNDAIQSLAGNLLSNSQAYTQVFLNSGFRQLQRKLANAGYQTLKKTTILTNITPVVPPSGTTDPGVTVSIGYTAYFDGTNSNATPLLPADLCWPLRLRERQSGTQQMFQQMIMARDGLLSRPQGLWLRDWIWQNEQILMNGATQKNDLELYYVPFLPELILGLPTPAKVPIVRCENALAAYTLAMYALSRGSELAPQAMTMADGFMKDMLGSDAQVKQRGNYRRRSYSGRSHSGWGM